MFSFLGVVDVLDYDKYYPDQEFQKHWLKRYLQVCAKQILSIFFTSGSIKSKCLCLDAIVIIF